VGRPRNPSYDGLSWPLTDRGGARTDQDREHSEHTGIEEPITSSKGYDDVAGRLFTSESVTEGHPDKIADQISDTVLDAMLEQDTMSRVAVETLLTTGLVVVAGEVTTTGYVDVKKAVRDRILAIGYDSSVKGFDGHSCGVMVAIGGQSGDIAQGVDTGYESRHDSVDPMDKQGAGDQGLMFGYACDDTPELMPLPIMIAHRLAERLTAVRKSGAMSYLRPDGKTQVTIEYDDEDRPVRVDTVVVSTQHAKDISLDTMLAPDIAKQVVDPVLEQFDIASDGYRLLVNPTGRFEVGGPMGDAGLTGRKIIIDTYGGMARHGGGAFSGKDPSKVDRSAAYAMRWVAKNVVAAGLARRCEVQVAYAIGKAQPVGFYVDCFGTESVPVASIQKAVLEVFDLRPAAIIRDLDLLRPIYAATASYGHFGRELPEFTWERTDRVDALKQAAGV
jgi:S-adenosylmethionine synthetase